MIEYIFLSIVSTYCMCFCVAFAHALYKEARDERRKRIIEYEVLSRQNLSRDSFLESNILNSRMQLESITEVDESEV